MLKNLYKFEKCKNTIYDCIHENCLVEKVNEEQLRVFKKKEELSNLTHKKAVLIYKIGFTFLQAGFLQSTQLNLFTLLMFIAGFFDPNYRWIFYFDHSNLRRKYISRSGNHNYRKLIMAHYSPWISNCGSLL